jgi:hypothetical protein
MFSRDSICCMACCCLIAIFCSLLVKLARGLHPLFSSWSHRAFHRTAVMKVCVSK